MKQKTVIIVVIVFLLVPAILYWAFFMREYSEWEDTINLYNGEKLNVKHQFSARVFHGHPALIGWGGGDPRHRINFKYQEADIKWNGKFIPIVLDFSAGNPYMVVFDRETEVGENRFRFYIYLKEWEEITASKFPKRIAIQNMWLSENNGSLDGKIINEYEIVSQLDPNSYLFRDSLTAKLWQELEKGIKLYDSDNEVTEDLLIYYKTKYIQNHGKR